MSPLRLGASNSMLAGSSEEQCCPISKREGEVIEEREGKNKKNSKRKQTERGRQTALSAWFEGEW